MDTSIGNMGKQLSRQGSLIKAPGEQSANLQQTPSLAKQEQQGVDSAAPSSSAATQAPAQGAVVEAAQAQGAEGEASPVGTKDDGQGQTVQVLPLLPTDSAVH